MASVSSATFSGHGARSLLQFLRLVGQLKRVPRTGWVYRNVQRPESVSDHMYRMAVMAMVIKDDRLNKDRCVRLALVHDMAECIVGDIAPADNIPKEEKHRREEEAMKQITQLLPEDLRKELYELWEEYETQSSAEAKFVKQLDQCEMILQASEYEDLEHKPGRLQDFYDSTAGRRSTKPTVSIHCLGMMGWLLFIRRKVRPLNLNLLQEQNQEFPM
ncbi:HD domain-containing protein 2 isoform X1 [Nomascus leucogenys]|uniref:HD domain-containing protein 2 isoform X1 n=1 Tax=Nomascus leucogenys TaxID=61853 RepID=UPI00122D9E94|nr:HD domain-containing protein 2 isoform X1 [Nomascus leucogenys]XP_055119249.1 5'-deoxynucleotidase HDDC2 isoform X2 [Symphalangus syndactylus]XP_055119263.1 5'-deoxynucleotidase HDDC2 isoform X2 [Symphalangus syndactylus]